ncbi:ABC transporter substrate binding protein [Caldisericum exile AZM16c01]|uniref:ABC transporter substrate binding protein n=2 Tax=Caldisericum exile TaxID=693075 RepID=A0A7U6GFR0_CALEA|nr:extracellular solute-binding protein [Caldisericum exile]BAL81570.1 ABC transporter substrate binding protein [Caldisericum exile AZM16c01]
MKKTLMSKFAVVMLLIVFFASFGLTGCAKKTTMVQTGTGNAYLDNLIKAAQKEGELTVIALPHDWANYGEIISTFSKKYGIKVNELDPNAGSGDEIEAIKANKGSTGPQAPDVIDVGLAWGPTAKDQGLIQPYKVQTWDTIPNDVKDPDGYWYGDYYGVLAFEVNSSVIKDIPQDWSDLLKPEYKGKVALGGDPRTSAMAAMAVAAAALSNGGSFDNVMPGLQYFAQLNKLGNFVPVIAKPGTIASGETPIAMMWDYLALTDRDNFNGNPEISVVIPKSSVVAGVYVQAISAYAPHPNAAKLWMEFLYSDEGQLLYLKGYVHPIRYNDLAKRNVIPEDLAKKLPPAELYAKAIFPTIDQITKAKQDIANNWDKVVNVNVK